MDGKIFASSLVNLKGQELRMLYALLFKTNIVSLIGAKTKDIFNKDVDHFNADLQKEIAKIEHISDEALQLELFLRLTEIFELKGTHYDLPLEIEQQSALIISEIHKEMKKEDKDYKEFISSAEDKTELQLLIQYQMQKLFSTFDGKFRELESNEQDDFTAKIHQFIDELPAEKQTQLKDKLKIDDLTNESIRQVMMTQGSVIVLSIIVEVAGFAAYTTLTTAIATTMAIVGVTLPFGVYTFATSLLSLIVNPFILVPLVLGGGGWLLARQNKNLRKKLVPVVVLQMTLPTIIGLGNADETKFQPFISRWQHHKDKQQELVNQKHEFLKEIAYREKKVKKHEQEIAQRIKKLKKVNEQRQQIRISCAQLIYSIQPEEQSSIYNTLLQVVASKKEKIASLEIEMTQNANQTGFWNTITTVFDNSSLRSDIRSLTKDIEQTEVQLIDELLVMKSTVLQDERARYTAFQDEVELLLQERSDYSQKNMVLNREILDFEDELREVKKELKDHQKRYYGLNDIV